MFFYEIVSSPSAEEKDLGELATRTAALRLCIARPKLIFFDGPFETGELSAPRKIVGRTLLDKELAICVKQGLPPAELTRVVYHETHHISTWLTDVASGKVSSEAVSELHADLFALLAPQTNDYTQAFVELCRQGCSMALDQHFYGQATLFIATLRRFNWSLADALSAEVKKKRDADWATDLPFPSRDEIKKLKESEMEKCRAEWEKEQQKRDREYALSRSLHEIERNRLLDMRR